MQVWGDDDGAVHFSATELAVPALTWIVDVPVLENLLCEALRFQPQIEVLDSPQPAALTVVCEGKASRTRAEWGVDYSVTRYPQHAIAARMQCDKPHGQVARQWFTQGEILAFLPLDGPHGHTVGMVWSAQAARAPELLASSAADFCAELEKISQHSLGALQLTSERASWPLQNAQASRWVGVLAPGQSWVLAGDAAHTVHPLAGQGLNLGLGDVAELVRVLHARAYWRSVGDPKLLRQFERARRTEVSTTALAMDALQRLFSQRGSAWQALRNWGMKSFDLSGPAKDRAARYAMGL